MLNLIKYFNTNSKVFQLFYYLLLVLFYYISRFYLILI